MNLMLLVSFYVVLAHCIPISVHHPRQTDASTIKIQLKKQDGTPVTGTVRLIVRSDSDIKNQNRRYLADAKIVAGSRSKQARNYFYGRTTPNGFFQLEVPSYITELRIMAHNRQIGAVQQKWHRESEVQTLVLQSVTFAGKLVDEAGQPITNARIVQLPFSKNPTDSRKRELHTDALGNWEFSSIYPLPHITISHPEYLANRFILDESFLKSDQLKKIVLEKGIAFAGRVSDENDMPIANAMVYVTGKFHTSRILTNPKPHYSGGQYRTQSLTDELGEFEFNCAASAMTTITIIADGYAIEMKQQNLAQNNSKINFALEKSAPTTINVVDQQGLPIAGCDVALDAWQRYPTMAYMAIPLCGVTDKRGTWICRSAPTDEFSFRAIPSKKTNWTTESSEKLRAGKTSTIVLPKNQIVTGTVLDCDTGKLVERFRVTPKILNSNRLVQDINRGGNIGFRGKVQLQRKTDSSGNLVFHVAAKGFEENVTEAFAANLEKIDFTIKLKPKPRKTYTVFQPDGLPAIGATISLGDVDRPFTVTQGVITRADGRKKFIADNSANFVPSGRIKNKLTDKSLSLKSRNAMVVHETGYAYFLISDHKQDRVDRRDHWVHELPETIKLRPWKTIVAKISLTNNFGKPKMVRAHSCFENPLPFGKINAFCVSNAVERDGHYCFEFVPDIATAILVSPESKRKGMVQFGLTPEQFRTGTIQLGDNSVAVKGKFRLADDFEPEFEKWGVFSLSDVTIVNVDGNFMDKSFRNFFGTPSDQAYRQGRRASNSFTTLAINVVSPTGEFYLENVPVGKHTLIFGSTSKDEFVFDVNIEPPKGRAVLDLGEFVISDKSKRLIGGNSSSNGDN